MGCGSSKSTAVETRKPLAKQLKKGKPILYIWPGSAPCRAVLMTARAASIDLQISHLDVFKNEHKSDEFKQINPECIIPTLVDGDHKIWDSHEIMKDIINKYSCGNKIYPDDTDIRDEVDKYLNYDQEEAYPVISNWIYPQVFGRIVPDSSKKTQVGDVLRTINETLAVQKYVAANHVTIADLSLMSTFSLLELLDWDFTKWEYVQKWRNKLKDLPYYPETNKGLEDWKFYLHVREMQENEE